MNTIRRLTAAVAELAGALLAFAAVAPAALAQSFPPRPPGWDKHPPLPPEQVTGPVLGPNRAGYPPISKVRTIVIGGMPGLQIALIAIGAALLAATVAVLLDRVRTAAKLPRWPGRATPAPPSAASAGQNRPESTTMSSRLRTMIAPGLLPHTLQPCIHCQQNPAGFWISQKRARTVRRPWCLSCCDGLDRSRCDVIAFGSQKDPDGSGRSQSRPSLLLSQARSCLPGCPLVGRPGNLRSRTERPNVHPISVAAGPPVAASKCSTAAKAMASYLRGTTGFPVRY